MKRVFILLMGVLFLFSVANAKQQRPVKHAHNGKSHTHILPNNGKGKHNHRGNHNTKGAFYSKSVAHIHNGRKHSHVLPNGRKNHNHGGASKKSAYVGVKPTNTTIVSYKGKKVPIDSRYIVRDQNNCIHFNRTPQFIKRDRNTNIKSVHWEGKCINGYAEGYGAPTYYYRDYGRYKNQRMKRPKNLKTRRDLYNKAVSLQNDKKHEHDKRVYKAKKLKEKEIRRKQQIIVNRDLIKFAKKYNFNSLIKGSTDIRASWYSDDKKSGVNGNGKVTLSLERGHTAEANISGNFRNGVLIGTAKMRVYASKCYDKGWVFCHVSESDSTTISITPSSNIKKLANNTVDNMLPGMYRRASRTISRRNSNPAPSYTNNSSSSSSSLSSSKSSTKVWKCTFTCKGGTETEIQVSASSHNKAEDKSYKHAHKVCKHAQVVSHWGSGKIACR